MDLLDLYWNYSQHTAIDDLQAELSVARLESGTAAARQAKLIQLLRQENDELRLRVGVLIRLLVQQGVISAEQYSSAVTDAKASIAVAQAPKTPQRKPSPRPKPPKLNPAKAK